MIQYWIHVYIFWKANYKNPKLMKMFKITIVFTLLSILLKDIVTYSTKTAHFSCLETDYVANTYRNSAL
jgi:hypothetical protein